MALEAFVSLVHLNALAIPICLGCILPLEHFFSSVIGIWHGQVGSMHFVDAFYLYAWAQRRVIAFLFLSQDRHLHLAYLNWIPITHTHTLRMHGNNAASSVYFQCISSSVVFDFVRFLSLCCCCCCFLSFIDNSIFPRHNRSNGTAFAGELERRGYKLRRRKHTQTDAREEKNRPRQKCRR